MSIGAFDPDTRMQGVGWSLLCAKHRVLCFSFLKSFLQLAIMKRVCAIQTKLVQRINVSFCVKLGLTQAVTIGAIKGVFKDDALSVTWIKFWYNAFKNGRNVLLDLPRHPRPRIGHSPAHIDTIRRLVQADKRVSVKALEAQTGIPHSTVHTILKKDLKLTQKSAKFVPKLLTAQHLRQRMEACTMMLNNICHNPRVLKQIITMDDAWIYAYDPELKSQSSQWLQPGEQRPQKAIRTRAVGKTLLISFFDHRGLVYHEFLRNRTVTKRIFIRILSRFKTAVAHRRPKVHQWFLHMDNAPVHNARDTKLFLLFAGIQRLQHPPYSPDLAPNDFWFYPRLKKHLRGKVFPNLDALEEETERQMGLISTDEFHNCMLHSWPMRWARCVYHDGAYFEGLK